jgi:hypothetical protein
MRAPNSVVTHFELEKLGRLEKPCYSWMHEPLKEEAAQRPRPKSVSH